MAVRMKGKEMDLHRHWREDYRHGQMASHLMTMEATVRSLMTTTILMVPEVTSYSLEGLGLRPASSNSSHGKFADAGRRVNRNGLINPDGNFGVQRPDILEGLFKKSFCSTKQVSLFLHS